MRAQAAIRTLVTSTTSAVQSIPTSTSAIEKAFLDVMQSHNGDGGGGGRSSTVNGVVIGLLSSFGSALLVALIFLVIYFFRYTSQGRVFLDRMGRPGEYDDEQALAKEEEQALEEMDDLQRSEYLRAKGTAFPGTDGMSFGGFCASTDL